MADMVCLVCRSCGVHKQCWACMACWNVNYVVKLYYCWTSEISCMWKAVEWAVSECLVWLLGWAWASPTLAWLHCGSVCVSMFGPTTYRRFQMSAFKYFTMGACWTCTSAKPKPWERAWRATARLQVRHEGEREQRPLKLNALAAHTATYFLNYGTWYESGDHAWLLQGKLRVTENVRYW